MKNLPRSWSSWLALGLILVVATLATSGTVNVPYVFTPNTPVLSSQVNANFAAIFGEFNGSITDANVSSLSESKVTFSGSGHAHSGGLGGAPVQYALGADITSAATLTITTDGNRFRVNGSTGPITALSTRNAGVFACLHFASTPTLTHNASLILFGSANYTTSAGDVLCFESLGSGNWRQIAGPNVITTATGITANRSANSVAIAVASPPIVAVATSDETVNGSDTLQDDDQIALAVAANTNYLFTCSLHYSSGTTPDIKWAFTVPSGASIRWGIASAYLETGGAAAQALSINASGSATSMTGSVNDLHVMLAGRVRNGASAGNLRLQWAQAASNASDTIRRTDSWCRAEVTS